MTVNGGNKVDNYRWFLYHLSIPFFRKRCIYNVEKNIISTLLINEK